MAMRALHGIGRKNENYRKIMFIKKKKNRKENISIIPYFYCLLCIKFSPLL
jgi:hypothetical protein